ncbi:FeoA domain-containing protein [Desulfobotulus sp. H1]|uniref:FeoA domain-containing protein n=1 Tax=Desulfobotulus pelophilus TaxID=2823377 RepID=A0ABT3N9D2_9BACT|nr:FeoA domain-containing protein [Desulfobotulus pelophilus]MCW7754072.1 FeoA domain-containing protein [Desulfobotulus pelophilus]
MLFHLDQAPCNRSLILSEIDDAILSDRLARMGIYAGDSLMRLDEEVHLGPVRVHGPRGHVVLAGGMAAKVIVHHDDGHKTPVLEMLPGETGHVEGLVCGSSLAEGLEILGIRENDNLRMEHRVPPMNYLIRMGNDHFKLTEGMATKIWGEMEGRELQFAMAGRGKPFLVKQLIGGSRALSMLDGFSIAPGKVLFLEAVTPAQPVGHSGRNQVIVAMKTGLRLYLRPDQAQRIRVIQPGRE